LEGLIENLSQFGLTEYESRVYLTLLEKGALPVSELSFESRVPRTKIYPTVRSLESKKLLIKLPEEPLKYKALPPEQTLFDNLDAQKERVKKMRRTIDKLTKVYQSSQELLDFEKHEVWSIKEEVKFRQRLRDMLQQARHEIFAIVCGDSVNFFFQFKEFLKSAHFRDVHILLVTEANEKNAGSISELMQYCDIKHLNVTPQNNLCVVDNKEALFFKENPSSGIYVNDTNLPEYFSKMYLDTVSGMKDVKVVLPLIIDKLLSRDAIKPLDYSALDDFFYYALYSWIYENFDKSKAQSIVGSLGTKVLKTFSDKKGINLISSNFEESLRLLADLHTLNENIIVRFKVDTLIKFLTCEIKGPLSIPYQMAAKSSFELPPSIWSAALMGIIEHFGYDSRVLKAIYDEKKDLWLIQRKLIQKKNS
jgi:HTH-type transcriptional regulator, sugar sensing transcriptional regulator